MDFEAAQGAVVTYGAEFKHLSAAIAPAEG